MSGLSNSKRPFRIYDERELRDMPWRTYCTAEHAVEKALCLVYWQQVGYCLTVYDSRSSRAIKQFKHRPNGDIGVYE